MEEIMATTTREVRLVGEPRPPRPRHTGFRIAAAATVAVIAAGVALNGQDDSGSTAIPGAPIPIGTTDLPRLVPDDVPDGYHPITVAEYGQLGELGKSVYLGHTTGGGLPVADLTISWGNEDGPFDPAAPSDPDLDPVSVRGHDGFSCSGDACAVYGPGVQAGIEWSEHEDQPFRLTSPSLTVDQLVAVADGLVISGHDQPPEGPPPSFAVDLDEVEVGPLPDDLPVPLDELGRSDYEGPDPIVSVNGHWEPIPDLRDFVEVVYWTRDLSKGLGVIVEPGQQFDLAGKLAATDAEPIADVRGHPAWAVTLPAGSGFSPGSFFTREERRQIFWQEEPGVIVTIETVGRALDDDVLRDVAESLHALTDAEWDALDAEARHAATQVDVPEREVQVTPIEGTEDGQLMTPDEMSPGGN
jgi:hypothetical protein